MTLPKDTVLWSDWAAKAWGNDWTIGKATAKAKAKHAKWNYEKNEYVCSMTFVTRTEYHTQRELWFQHVYKTLNNKIDTLTYTDEQGRILALEEELKIVESNLAVAETEILSLSEEVGNLKEQFSERIDAQRDISADIAWVKSYLYQGRVQDALVELERLPVVRN